MIFIDEPDEDGQCLVRYDDEPIGAIWQMHRSGNDAAYGHATGTQPAHHRVATGQKASWCAETTGGDREWFRTPGEAVDWLADQMSEMIR